MVYLSGSGLWALSFTLKWVDFRVAPLCPHKGIEKDRERSACIYNDRWSIWKYRLRRKKEALYCFHSNQLPLRVHDFFFFSPPLFTTLIAQYWVTNKADYHYLLLQSVSGIFDWSRKNLGLFMSLRIDLTLVRMNCRSIGLPPGRLNEQAQHRGLLLSCFIVFNRRRATRRRTECNDFQFPALPTLLLRQRLSRNQTWFKGIYFSLFFMVTTERYCDIFVQQCVWLMTFWVILYSISIPHYFLCKAILKTFFGIWMGQLLHGILSMKYHCSNYTTGI